MTDEIKAVTVSIADSIIAQEKEQKRVEGIRAYNQAIRDKKEKEKLEKELETDFLAADYKAAMYSERQELALNPRVIAPNEELPAAILSTMTDMFKNFLKHTNKLEEDEVSKIVASLVSIRDHPESGDRDRVMANNQLLKLVEMGIDVKLALLKYNRIDEGKATEQVNVDKVFKVTFDN